MNAEIAYNASLKAYNSFGIDVRTAVLATVSTPSELKEIILDPSLKPLPKLVVGGGSNLLLTADYPGVMILNRIKGIQSVDDGIAHRLVTAGAGVVWHELVQHTVAEGWGGLENLSLIPGTVGAAPIQNIGAYGVEIKDTFVSLQAVSLEDGSDHTFTPEQCHFGYRDSVFKHEAKGKFAIVAVTFRLSKAPQLNTAYGAIENELKSKGIAHPTISDVSDAVISIRTSKLPDPSVLGNAGSFFKNPEIPESQFKVLKSRFPDVVAYPAATGKIKLAAGWLIEQCGWKGKRIGNVGMHMQQALVLVNYGGATGKELFNHARNVQESVEEKFGVLLEMEVNIL